MGGWGRVVGKNERLWIRLVVALAEAVRVKRKEGRGQGGGATGENLFARKMSSFVACLLRDIAHEEYERTLNINGIGVHLASARTPSLSWLPRVM